jgi:hypothetical protein
MIVPQESDPDVVTNTFDLRSFVLESLRWIPFCKGRGCGSLIVFPSVDTVTHVGGVMGAMFSGQCEMGENFGMQFARGARTSRLPLKSIYSESDEIRKMTIPSDFITRFVCRRSIRDLKFCRRHWERSGDNSAAHGSLDFAKFQSEKLHHNL